MADQDVNVRLNVEAGGNAPDRLRGATAEVIRLTQAEKALAEEVRKRQALDARAARRDALFEQARAADMAGPVGQRLLQMQVAHAGSASASRSRSDAMYQEALAGHMGSAAGQAQLAAQGRDQARADAAKQQQEVARVRATQGEAAAAMLQFRQAMQNGVEAMAPYTLAVGAAAAALQQVVSWGLKLVGAASPSAISTLNDSFTLLQARLGKHLIPAVEFVSRRIQALAAEAGNDTAMKQLREGRAIKDDFSQEYMRKAVFQRLGVANEEDRRPNGRMEIDPLRMIQASFGDIQTTREATAFLKENEAALTRIQQALGEVGARDIITRQRKEGAANPYDLPADVQQRLGQRLRPGDMELLNKLMNATTKDALQRNLESPVTSAAMSFSEYQQRVQLAALNMAEEQVKTDILKEQLENLRQSKQLVERVAVSTEALARRLQGMGP